MGEVRTEQVVNGDEQKEQLIPISMELQLRGGGVFYLIIERERDGQTEREIIEIKNLITDLGLDIFIRNLINSSPVSIGYIVLSDSTTTPSPTETTMPGTNKWAQAATVSRPTARQARWQASWAQGAIVGTIGSIGLCSDSAGNNLFARVRLSTPKNVGADDTVSVVYDLTLSRQS
jgi:alpha-galactosidase